MTQLEIQAHASRSHAVIESDTIRVYLGSVSSLTARHHDRLPRDERARAARFAFEEDRSRFVLGRAMLRSVLGPVLGIPSAHVALRVGASGKPEIWDGGGPGFNLSHSGRYVAVALVRAGRVGIDIELHDRHCDFLAIARAFFCPAELAVLGACPEHAKALFFRYWTLKEAYLKAVGTGLSGPLRDVDVSQVRDGPVLEGQASVRGMGLHVLRAPPGYSAAVAADGRHWRVCVEEWE